MTIRVIGLDLSLSSTGVAVVTGRTHTVRPVAKADAPARRLSELVQRVDHLIRTGGRPDIAVLEAVHYSPNMGGTAMKLAELAGAMKLRLYELDIPFVPVPAPALKKWATGKGNATKDEMVVAAGERGGFPANDDEADAFLLRAMGIEFGRHHPNVSTSDDTEERLSRWLKGGTL